MDYLLSVNINLSITSRLVLQSKALYHTCFICGQRCKCWTRRPKLTSSVISDVKPIIYIFYIYVSIVYNISGTTMLCGATAKSVFNSIIDDAVP